MRRLALLIVAAAAAVSPAAAWAQRGNPYSTKAVSVLESMFTTDSEFGLPGHAAAPFTCASPSKRTAYYNTTDNLIYYCNGTAWEALAKLSGATFTGPVLLPDGTAAAPSLAFASEPGTGLYRASPNDIAYAAGSQARAFFTDNTNGSEIRLQSDGFLTWSSDIANATAGAQTFLSSEAAAVLQVGQDVNGAPTHQTLKAHDGITGTDVAGASLTLAGGRGTGAGAAGNVIIQAAPDLASGTTPQVLEERARWHGKRATIADNTATTIMTVATGGAAGGSGGLLHIQARAVSGSESHSLSALLSYTVADDVTGATGEVCSFALAGAAAQTSVTDAGSYTLALATTTGTDTCNLRITLDTTLNVSSTVRLTILNTGGSALSGLP